MNELQIFNSPEFGDIRTVEIDGKPYFVGTDVAKALGYAKPNNAVSTHCRYTLKRGIATKQGNMSEMVLIPEGDIYRLIIRSKLSSAERFERWVFDEVLPAIHHNGDYIMGQENLSDSELMAKAILVAQKTIEHKNQIIEQQKAKIEADRPKQFLPMQCQPVTLQSLLGI